MTYIVLVLPAIIFALWAQANVKSAFNKYSKYRNSAGITGADAANLILADAGISVPIESVGGKLTDHYDPRTNAIRLSDSVYNSTSTAAVGIACHEAGHAMQHNLGYAPIRIRNAIVPVCQIGSNIAMPLVVLGLILSFPLLANIGVIAFLLATLFQLLTLPVEFDASRRAVAAINASGRFSAEESKQAEKVLRAAALTYVAALAVALANFIRILMLVNRRRK